jgi:hypothetical protein
MEYEDHQGDDQKEMDETSSHVKGESAAPEDEKNDGDDE